MSAMKRPKSPELEDGNIKQRKRQSAEAVSQQEAKHGASISRPGGEGDWSLWGPYLAERQWGTVREDTSKDGDCWASLSHEAALRTAYKSGEDGLLGVCDSACVLCTSVALWNYKDSCLKERLFGLTSPQGNHGEDVKELYYYLDNNSTHSYMRALYKYPQESFPFTSLLSENSTRDASEPEFEILDTGVFDSDKYWDVYLEYAKISCDDLVCSVTVRNLSPHTEKLIVIPQVWLRNTWSPGCTGAGSCKPGLELDRVTGRVQADCSLGQYCIEFYSRHDVSDDGVLFTDNETREQVQDVEQDVSQSPPHFYKDAFHRYIVNGETLAVNPNHHGSKCGAPYWLQVPPGGQEKIHWTLLRSDSRTSYTISQLEDVIQRRKAETKIFYSNLMLPEWSQEEQNIARQAVAGILWSKQFYLYDVDVSLDNIRLETPTPSPSTEGLSRSVSRNTSWPHIKNSDVITVPDKWEFPWYAPWDLAFHMLPLMYVDVAFCQQQLQLFLTDRYMKEDGQLPGCEFNLDDPNPPLHAWACLSVSRVEGGHDVDFLSRCYSALTTNQQWWLSRLTSAGLYTGGGFLGMDNISVIDRSEPVPAGYTLSQADGTAWVAMCTLNMLEMSLLLATARPGHNNQSARFLDDFLHVAVQMNKSCYNGGLWHVEDKFFYDVLSQGSETVPLRIKSMVGLVSMFASMLITVPTCPGLETLTHRLEMCTVEEKQHVHVISSNKYYLTLVPKSRLADILTAVCDPDLFLSPFGVRSLAKTYNSEPYSLDLDSETYTLRFAPGESDCDLFGGNSNWRGPIWLCMNHLLVESLDRASQAYRDTCLIEDGTTMSLADIATDICRRVVDIFLPSDNDIRPIHGGADQYHSKPGWRDLLLFYEFFHSETGRGCGASHQTGWTALVLNFLYRKHSRP